MKYWLIVHSLESFNQNPNLIGFAAKAELDGRAVKDKEGKLIPAFKTITEIKSGDKIIYYCKGDSVIKGIFEIAKPVYAQEPQWPDSPFQFQIKPLLVPDEPFNIKLILSSLELFSHLDNIKNWGMALQGKYNSIKELSVKDFQFIENTLKSSKKIEKEELPKQLEKLDREHLRIQHKIAEWGLKNGYRVHIAINDRNKLKKELPQILDELPHFHYEDVLDIAKRIDVLFFDKERDILTHAFEVESTPIIYSGLLRLNDIVEKYPSDKLKYFIISDKSNRDKFFRELDRPSFYLLRKHNCEFLTFEDIDEQWEELKKQKPSKF